MIIENGTIEVKIKSGGGFNPVTGYPNKGGTVTWGKPIPCQYMLASQNKLLKVRGEPVSDVTYIILIEQSNQPFVAEQIRLKDNLSEQSLGEFSIISVERLDAVCEIKIIV